MPENLAYRIYRLMWESLDWLYPPTCGGCSRRGVRWCDDCAQATNELVTSICPICGDLNENGKICSQCEDSRPFYECLRSYTIYQGPIREAIHRLKYNRDVAMGEMLSRLMIGSIEKLNWSLDIITPVPLGLVRFKERGYNQSTLLARPIALWFETCFLPGALKRKRETRTQVGLTAVERQANMRDAFEASHKLISGKKVLVVDDVATSGATLNACSKALLDEGALNVYCFTLARAVFSPNIDQDIS